MQEAAELIAAIQNMTSLVWMTKIAKAAARDEVPFEDPKGMEEFKEVTVLLTSAMILKDVPAFMALLIAAGVEEAAAKILQGHANPLEGHGKFVEAMNQSLQIDGVPMPAYSRRLMRETFLDFVG